jgi:hypothetical protein
MSNFSNLAQEWKTIQHENLFSIPTERPLICMEHKKSKERAYFDVKKDRLLSQQEAFDALRGFNW